ncbi:MAG: thiamine pyrophosphate-dependent enzyme [Dehalococcoidia bacterium]|jgi:2-oxoglutarate ferredoxin oxidoreductase subunit beta|nr:thiamine pyrophosphate-dependent enzyme [Dehalococcoidia bacterium]
MTTVEAPRATERRQPVKPKPMQEYIEVFGNLPDEKQGRHFRYCPGCGLGIAQSAIVRAWDRIGLDPEKVVTVGGSGCYAVMGSYLTASQAHMGHGRACAMATAIKMSDPELTVITLQGDGDGMAIGAQHFVHAARRNIDITVVIFNNFVYGETGGQHGPTTPRTTMTQTSPYGMVENEFDIVNMALGAGAGYAARTTVFHAQHMVRAIEGAIRHKGFSVVEILQNCHELWGKRNGMPKATDMLAWYRDNSVTSAQAAKLEPEDVLGKFVIGTWTAPDRPEMSEEWQKLVARVQAGEVEPSKGASSKPPALQ